MSKYICKYCKKESTIKNAWSGQMMIGGSLYYIEDAPCEHCKGMNNIKKIKLT